MRHLIKIAEFTGQLNVSNLHTRLTLDRRQSKQSEPDELDQIVLAINDLQVRLKKDIEKRAQTEEALNKSKEWLSTTLRSIGDAVIAADVKGNVTL